MADGAVAAPEGDRSDGLVAREVRREGREESNPRSSSFSDELDKKPLPPVLRSATAASPGEASRRQSRRSSSSGTPLRRMASRVVLPVVDASVDGAEQDGKVTYYRVHVKYDEKTARSRRVPSEADVWRRYSQFKDMHRELSQGSRVELPPMPPGGVRRFFARHRPMTVAERTESFSALLETIVANPHLRNAPAFRTFCASS